MVQNELEDNLRSISTYLNDIVTEYGRRYETFHPVAHELPLDDLPKLKEFIGDRVNALDFESKFRNPTDQLLTLANSLLNADA